MAYYKPQSPIKNGEDYIYPLTTADQVMLEDGSRLNAKFITSNLNQLEMNGDNVYPITTHDQIIMEDGSRWDGKSLSNGGSVNGAIEAPSFIENGVSLEAKYAQVSMHSAKLSAAGWSATAPYTQTVLANGILATDNPFVDVDASSATDSDTGLAITEAWSFIGRVTANNGTITAYCYSEKPEVDLNLILTVMR